MAALLNDNEALVEGMCKELPAFAKRAFNDSDDQFNAWVKDVKENIPVSTAPSQTSLTSTVAPIEEPKKRVISSFKVQSKELQRESRFAQITEQARVIANSTVTEPQSEQHSPAVASFVASPQLQLNQPRRYLRMLLLSQHFLLRHLSFHSRQRSYSPSSTIIRLILLSPIQSRKKS